MERTYKKTSDDIRKRFCESIDNGSSRKDASRIMGVPDYTGRSLFGRRRRLINEKKPKI